MALLGKTLVTRTHKSEPWVDEVWNAGLRGCSKNLTRRSDGDLPTKRGEVRNMVRAPTLGSPPI